MGLGRCTWLPLVLLVAGSAFASENFSWERRLAISSGKIADEVTGRSSGRDLDKKQPAISQEPTSATPLGALWNYFVGLRKWDPDGEPTLPEETFRTFSANEFLTNPPAGFLDPNVSELLQGVWCGPWHPSDLACFFPYASFREQRNGIGIPSQGGLPGKMLFWDSPGNRNTLEFFTRYSVEFQIPKWAGGVEPGKGSGFWTYMRGVYGLIPYPAAVYEGLPKGHHNLVPMRSISGDAWWDPESSTDPALCFCSITYESNNVIRRNNFGRLAYHVYRVIDEHGMPTEHAQKLDEWAKGRKLVAIRDDQELYPDLTCSGWCRFAVSMQVLLVFKFIIILPCCCCLGCCVCGLKTHRDRRKHRLSDVRELELSHVDDPPKQTISA